MDIVFHHEDKEGIRVVEVIRPDENDLEKIVWKSRHGTVEFAPSDSSCRTWEASGTVSVRTMEVLTGRVLTDKGIAVFRASGILGIPKQRGRRSIFPLSWNTIPVRDLRGMFMQILWDRRPSIPKDIEDFYFLPPLVLPRSRTYTSTALTRATRTELWVYCRSEPAEVLDATVCHEAQQSDGGRSFSPTYSGG